jgi:hypothetical protein
MEKQVSLLVRLSLKMILHALIQTVISGHALRTQWDKQKEELSYIKVF